MRIKKRLQINVAVSVLTALVICLMLLTTLHRVNRAMEASKIADGIVKSVFERSTFRDDYLRTNSERAKEQWFARHERVAELLKFAAEKFTDSEDKKTVDEMIRDHDSTGKLFSDIVKNREKAGSDAGSAALSQEIESRLLTQLIMRLYEKTLNASKLQKAGSELVFASLRQAGGGIAGILVIVIAVAVASSWTMSRTITDRISRLRDDAAVIGQGNLDHRIDIMGDDEFVELSVAFNAMTTKLRGSYHDLEKEIEERKKAEEELRETAAELQGANSELDDSRRAAINLMEDALGARRQAEQAAEALRESERKYSILFDTLAVAASLTKLPEIVFSDVNKAFEKLFGYTREEVVGKTSLELGLAKPEEHKVTSDEVERQGWHIDAEKHVYTKSGEERIVLINVIALELNGQSYALTTMQDITERKRAEDQIKASLAEKEVMLKEIHHRVKNNLQVISSLVGLQVDGTRDEKVREVLRDVTYRVRSMALVHEKLYQTGDLARIDFAEYAKSLLNYLWRAHGSVAANIRLTFDLEPLSLPVDTAVPCGLILNELAGNALKHAFRGRDRGEVVVSLQGSRDGLVSISLRDNGVGLPPELDWRQTSSLGLRLVQMLAGQLNAEVEVDRQGGTEFSVSFRLKAEG